MILATRWHEEDLIGYVLANDHDERWVHVRLPAIAECDETIETVIGERTAERLRKAGVPLPDWWRRREGEALWPETLMPDPRDPDRLVRVPWYDEEELAGIKAELGLYKWTALYQGAPAPPQGEMFPASMWDRADTVPPRVPLVRYWDLAATKDGGDETVGALLGRDDDGYVYVVDIVHGRWSASEVKRVLRATAERDAERFGRRVRILVEQEGGSAGKAWMEELLRGPLAGFNAAADPPVGDKVTRALGLAAQQQAGYVRLVRQPLPDGSGFGPQPWFDHLIEQARVFPHGAHDDLVDACSAAFNALTGRRRRRMRTRTAADRSVA